jgi:hypothetical protein
MTTDKADRTGIGFKIASQVLVHYIRSKLRRYWSLTRLIYRLTNVVFRTVRVYDYWTIANEFASLCLMKNQIQYC